jgi:hypothetical protein
VRGRGRGWVCSARRRRVQHLFGKQQVELLARRAWFLVIGRRAVAAGSRGRERARWCAFATCACECGRHVLRARLVAELADALSEGGRGGRVRERIGRRREVKGAAAAAATAAGVAAVLLEHGCVCPHAPVRA